MKWIFEIDKILEKVISYLAVISLLGMLFLSIFAIFMRYFGISFFWIEPLVRHLVFLSAFLGGILATGKNSHIAIDFIGNIFSGQKHPRLNKNLKFFSRMISIFTLIWLIWACYQFMLIELEFGQDVFWGIESGVLVGIIPAGLSFIAFRFFVLILKPLDQKVVS